MNFVPIERLSAVEDRERIADHFERGSADPLVVTDATADWPARDKWNLAFFAARYGGCVGIAPLKFGAASGKTTLLRAFIDHLDDPYSALPGVWVGADAQLPAVDETDRWSFAWEPFRNDPRLFDDISPFPSAIPNLTAALPRDVYEAMESIHGRKFDAIYISRKGTIAPLHHDWHHTFGCLVQFEGRKRVILLAPQEYERVGERDFNPEKPDYDSYPAMREQLAYSGTLEPTETLIIPPDWLHYTRSEDHSVTLSHNFFNAVNLGAFMSRLLDDAAKSPNKRKVFDQLAATLDGDPPFTPNRAAAPPSGEMGQDKIGDS